MTEIELLKNIHTTLNFIMAFIFLIFLVIAFK
jgi:hypothetical protein